MKLNKKLLASIDNNQFLQDQNIPELTLNGPLMYKNPLNFWTKYTFSDTHKTNYISSNKIHASFMRFHFHDKIQKK